MIHIIVNQVLNNISRLEIKGHAGYADKGEDLVCAGVSSIGIGLLNALDELSNDKVDMELNEGHILINVKDLNDHDVQLILNVGLIQLKTIELQYSKYIAIEKEV